MAQKVLIQLVDDLDGTELSEGAGETVEFALDGRSYEIDLSTENAKRLRDALAEFVDAARPASSRGGRRSSGSVSARGGQSGKRRDLAEVRVWARANGFKVSDRGRVPQNVLDAYDEAQ
ncbi:Nucleoid-associated protein Lsr2 [Pseudoclavibacter triregionum]|nr:Nucleoid-associated protein Lsr2 [Pseudoclavibacter triregionum]